LCRGVGFDDELRFKIRAGAEALMKRTLAINEKALGKDHPTVARTLRNYAALLRKTKREKEAKVLETKAKAILGKNKNGASKT